MKKIIQIVTGMYSEFDIDTETENQLFAIVALCSDNTIWMWKNGMWTNIDTSSIINYIHPHTAVETETAT